MSGNPESSSSTTTNPSTKPKTTPEPLGPLPPAETPVVGAKSESESEPEKTATPNNQPKPQPSAQPKKEDEKKDEKDDKEDLVDTALKISALMRGLHGDLINLAVAGVKALANKLSSDEQPGASNTTNNQPAQAGAASQPSSTASNPKDSNSKDPNPTDLSSSVDSSTTNSSTSADSLEESSGLESGPELLSQGKPSVDVNKIAASLASSEPAYTGTGKKPDERPSSPQLDNEGPGLNI